MKKEIIVASMLLLTLDAVPQAVVTDPSSMAQRIAIFLEEMEETISQSLDIAEGTENTRKLFQMTEQTVTDLKKVSGFIKTSRQFVSISEAEIRIAEKMEKYSERVKEMDSLSFNEKLNVIASIINLGRAAAERAKSGIEIVKNSSSDAKLSDYERLQILSQLEDEILSLEDAIDETYETSLSDETRSGILSTLSAMGKSAIMFDL